MVVIFDSLFFLYSICVLWTLAPIHIIKWREFFAKHLKMTSSGPPLYPWPCLFPMTVVKGLYSIDVKCLHCLLPTQHLKVKEDINFRLATRYTGCYYVACPLLFSCPTCPVPVGYQPIRNGVYLECTGAV